MTRFFKKLTALVILTSCVAFEAHAQRGTFEQAILGRTRGLKPVAEKVAEPDAKGTKQALDRVLKTYPPSLSQVLHLDPSLLSNTGYLAPYPKLADFLKEHPDVAHTPGYFFPAPKPAAAPRPTIVYASRNSGFDALSYFAVILTLLAIVAWLIRAAVDQRKSIQLTRSRMEAQMKILERFGSNEDLLNFIQTPAGQHFMDSSSMPPPPKSVAAPIAQILRSTQTGLVMLAAGYGLQYVNPANDIANYRTTSSLGILAMAVGVGFILSALSAYILSRKLGLLNTTNVTSETPPS